MADGSKPIAKAIPLRSDCGATHPGGDQMNRETTMLAALEQAFLRLDGGEIGYLEFVEYARQIMRAWRGVA